MREYINGLGISVKICKLYEVLIYLTMEDKHLNKTSEYINCIKNLKELIEEEDIVYDKLYIEQLDTYFKNILEDSGEWDNVKKRYCLKLKERIELLDINNYSNYPFTLNTVIFGKILLETLTKLENILKNENTNLYSYHSIIKYGLISSNNFLEKLALDFNFDLHSIPNITFDKIKNNFYCNNNFYNNLNNLLYLDAIDVIDIILNSNNQLDIENIYNNLFNISRLEVLMSYLNRDFLVKINNYLTDNNYIKYNNYKYINNVLKKMEVK